MEYFLIGAVIVGVVVIVYSLFSRANAIRKQEELQRRLDKAEREANAQRKRAKSAEATAKALENKMGIQRGITVRTEDASPAKGLAPQTKTAPVKITNVMPRPVDSRRNDDDSFFISNTGLIAAVSIASAPSYSAPCPAPSPSYDTSSYDTSSSSSSYSSGGCE